MPQTEFDDPDNLDALALPSPTEVGLMGTHNWKLGRRRRYLAAEEQVSLHLTELVKQGFLVRGEHRHFYLKVDDICDANAIVCDAEPGTRMSLLVIRSTLELYTCPGREQEIRIRWTDGTSRTPYRFLCPGQRRDRYDHMNPGCGREVLSLFLVPFPPRNYFACRFCHDLTYLSRQTKARMKRRTQSRPSLPPGTGGSFGGGSLVQA